MLVLQRTVGAYERAALVLVCDELVIGEVLVLSINGPEVRLGLNLADDIVVTRADAINRFGGPSDAWFAQQKAHCAVGNLALALPCDAHPDEPNVAHRTIPPLGTPTTTATPPALYTYRAPEARAPEAQEGGRR